MILQSVILNVSMAHKMNSQLSNVKSGIFSSARSIISREKLTSREWRFLWCNGQIQWIFIIIISGQKPHEQVPLIMTGFMYVGNNVIMGWGTIWLPENNIHNNNCQCWGQPVNWKRSRKSYCDLEPILSEESFREGFKKNLKINGIFNWGPYPPNSLNWTFICFKKSCEFNI